MSEKRFYRSGELAAIFGISSDTLRYYERRNLLPAPARSANRYREYPAASVQRIQLIRAALSIGFSVEELARILKTRDRGGVPCKDVRDLAQQKLAKIGEQLQELKRMQQDLRTVLREWDVRLTSTGNGQRAHLLEKLSSSPRRWKNKKKGETL
jgi:DNA-binding transcriptional MerR regulator